MYAFANDFALFGNCSSVSNNSHLQQNYNETGIFLSEPFFFVNSLLSVYLIYNNNINLYIVYSISIHVHILIVSWYNWPQSRNFIYH